MTVLGLRTVELNWFMFRVVHNRPILEMELSRAAGEYGSEYRIKYGGGLIRFSPLL